MPDNPNFPGSTGAAVADTMQGILLRKKQEARQSMLDQLNQRNVESEMANRDETTKSLAAERQAKTDESTIKRLDSSVDQPYQPVSEMNLPPEVLAAAQRSNRIVNHRPPRIPELGDQPGQFYSSPTERDKAEFEQGIKGLIGTLQSSKNPDNQNTIDALNIALATHQKLSPAELSTLAKPEQKKSFYDPNQNKWIDAPPGATSAGVIPFKPQPNAANEPQMYSREEQDPKDPNKTVKVSYWLAPREMPSDKNRISGGEMGKGRVPPPHTQTSATFPSVLRSQLIGGFSNLSKNRTPDNQATYNKIVSNVLQALPVTTYPQDVKDGIRDLYATYPGQPWEKVVPNITPAPGQPPMTTKEESQMHELWDLVNQPAPEQ